MGMRHPRTSLAPAIALAIALVLALEGCGERPARDASGDGATTSPVAAAEIPDDFPLSSGMGGPDDDLPTSRTGTGLRDLTLCGTAPLRGLGLRELVLLGSEDEALRVARAITDLALACDEPEVEGDMTTTTAMRESPYGPAPAATVLQTYTFGDGLHGSGTTISQVVPVGSALLVSSTYGEWPPSALDDGVADTEAALSHAVAAMAVFGDTSTPTPTPTSLPGPHPRAGGTTGWISGPADPAR